MQGNSKDVATEIEQLRNENAELKSQVEKHAAMMQEQNQELEQLRKLAGVVLKHFEGVLDNGCYVDRCMGCSRCDYEILGQALLPFKKMAYKYIP
ncbi:Uncharacterized [Syntrophomonas zehnderi OL-4]|uniref:Uncharacterized n=1 Tax=Syntrophomonas zehnderi OL-4 TaxID=690567 RepID=A0A0E4C9A0_9FIRM|nr:hypothetical protein [Syntrophomonas zehnderi]CFX89724.1 Uncharacterized [Syntrophomonas zehnderi OL-4]